MVGIDARLESQLTPLVEWGMEAHGLPGVAVGVVVGGDVVYAQGFGTRSVDSGAPVTPTTVFHMASVSKTFVAAAVMQLVERGRIDLASPAIDNLPYFRLADERCGAITIQHLLSHLSGMPDVDDNEWQSPQFDPGALERFVRGLSDRTLLHAPGERFAYSNMAFEVLGDVIAKVSGKTFADYEKDHVLDAAGMTGSTFLKPRHLPEGWAAPHLECVEMVAWEGYPYNRCHGPSSTLHSSAVEMCNWAITNLSRGAFGQTRVLDPSSFDLLWRPWAATDHGSARIGLGWFIGEHRGEASVFHGGCDVGFGTHLVLLPGRSMAAVVLGNFTFAPAQYLAHAALDVLLGFEPEPLPLPARVPVLRTLRREGSGAAAAHYQRLKDEEGSRYDCAPEPFLNLLDACILLDRAEDGAMLSQLCLHILPEPEARRVAESLNAYSQGHPENTACATMAGIMRDVGG